MMALAREAPSAAHWSYPQYEIAVGSVDRVASVIEEDSVIAAFVVARVLDREWEIENLIVAGECRRRGLGARLLNEMMKLARLQKAQSMFLEVRESNLAARSLYEKNGFVQAGRRLRYYHEPDEDAIVYRFTIA